VCFDCDNYDAEVVLVHSLSQSNKRPRPTTTRGDPLVLQEEYGVRFAGVHSEHGAARYALTAWKSVPLGRFTAPTGVELSRFRGI
jgi:hypothetical protein